MVVGQAQRLNRMIESLLDISRIQVGQFRLETAPLDLCTLVERVVTEVQPALERHTVTCTHNGTPLLVMGDALRLEQVIQNLLQNAVKYSPDGGAVRVHVERRNGEVALSVADDGIGIPQAAQELLFQRFYRAPNAEAQRMSGMGIGLYVVKEIVTLHGGRVEVASREGEGSIFTVTLPALSIN